jgi:hyperosmotically inducible periplasmic protein
MITKSTRTLALLAATCALFVSAQALSASSTDDRIESSAKNSYVFKTYLKHDSIKTVSEDGVVVLKGTVAQESHKTLAQDTVESLPGVKSVDNQLVVKEAPLPENSNEWLSLKVNTALMFHRNVSAGKTDVSVDNGVVTLRGEASSMAQKELTTEYAQDIEGVKTVVNEMTIAKSPSEIKKAAQDKIDDASITAQIKVLLMSHRSTSAMKTSIQTTDGVVTVTGIAKNDAEKSLVTKLVNDVIGVNSVNNEMTIEVPATTTK